MKNLTTLLFRITALVIGSMLMIACSDSEETPTVQSTDPIITEVGTPTGEVSSKAIGATGGTLESADGKLTVIIPAGALESTTTITIQPISNEGPLGLGSGYRLQPEGTIFSKAVKLNFHYSDQLLDGTLPDFLWIITQTDNGGWNALLKSSVDMGTRTVSVETNHFSDWALGRFIELSLSPSAATVLKGKSVELRVAGFSRDKAVDEDEELVPLIPLTGDAEVLSPLTTIPPIESRLMEFRIKRWTLNGTAAPVSNNNGSLAASKNNATYTAPNQKPTVNPVAVSVELESNNKEGKKGSYMLTSNIQVVDTDLYLILTVDGQTHEYYQYGFDGVLPSDPNNLSIVNCGITEDAIGFSASTVQNNVDMSNLFGMELHNPTVGTRTLSCFYADGDDDVNFMPTQWIAYEDERPIRTLSNDFCDVQYSCGAISVTLLEFKNEHLAEIRGSFSGILYEDKPENGGDCKNPEPHTIEGEFKLLVIK